MPPEPRRGSRQGPEDCLHPPVSSAGDPRRTFEGNEGLRRRVTPRSREASTARAGGAGAEAQWKRKSVFAGRSIAWPS